MPRIAVDYLFSLKESDLCKKPTHLFVFDDIQPRVVKPFVFDPYHYNKDGTKKLTPGLADDPPEVRKNRRYMQLQKQRQKAGSRGGRMGAGRGRGRMHGDRGRGRGGRGRGGPAGGGKPMGRGNGGFGNGPPTNRFASAAAIRGKRGGGTVAMGRGGVKRAPVLPPPPGARKGSEFSRRAVANFDRENIPLNAGVKRTGGGPMSKRGASSDRGGRGAPRGGKVGVPAVKAGKIPMGRKPFPPGGPNKDGGIAPMNGNRMVNGSGKVLMGNGGPPGAGKSSGTVRSATPAVPGANFVNKPPGKPKKNAS